MKACTIAARNYLAQVQVLAASFKAFHPAVDFVALVIDAVPGEIVETLGPGCKIIGLGEIGLPPEEIGRMKVIYNITEFSTAVKPWLLRHLLAAGASEVLYFDPDIEIFSPLDDLFELARKHSIVLTPHSTVPYPRDGLRLEESDILGAGIYNLGFLGIGQSCGKFLDWWAERLAWECIIDPAGMRFTDQRWVDFVPALYDHYILKDEGCNVAYWNLHGRRVEWTGGRYEVNGGPLRFFHFSGFDPGKPHLLSKHAGEQPRTLLSEEPVVARLCAEYARKLEQTGLSDRKAIAYRYDSLDNGLPITPEMRRMYRSDLIEAAKNERKKTGPFELGGTDAFVAWLNEPVTPHNPAFTRYLGLIHASRSDLRKAFPDPAHADSTAFTRWVHVHGQNEHNIPATLMPPAPDANPGANNTTANGSLPIEIDVIGYFQAELGVGEAARLLVSGIDAAGFSHNTISICDITSRQGHPFKETGLWDSGAKIKILCVNGDMTPFVARDMGPAFFHGSHTIGVWFWELEYFPESFFEGFEHVDEIWVASEFVARALRKGSTKPVHSFPLPVPDLRRLPPISRKELGLPEGYMFFFSFDFFSVFERKNPVALVRAFTAAFAPGEGPVLVIKSVNGHKKLPSLEQLRFAAAGRHDIVIMDRYLTHDRKDAMMAGCDCYVSLHRSEGFGLTMAEAMSLAKPVIATRYGGNLEFMTAENSYLCGFRECRVGEGNEPYPPGINWADPDIAEAAALMRHVYENRGEAAARGERAQKEIFSNHSPAACAGFLKTRLAAIGAARARRERKSGSFFKRFFS